MRKTNELNLYKTSKKYSRIEKLNRLIKKTLGEIFLSQDFRDSKGTNLLIFIDEVLLSKDGREATVFMTNFSKDSNQSDQDVLNFISDNLIRIKKEFSKKIDLRYTPKLKFKFDYERKKSFEIDRLINGLLPKS